MIDNLHLRKNRDKVMKYGEIEKLKREIVKLSAMESKSFE
jgi:hypothetical protein